MSNFPSSAMPGLVSASRKLAASLAIIATTLFGLLVITFVVGRLVPADPVIAVIGDQADRETYQRVYVMMGLDQPIYMQFFNYLRDVVTLNFGQSHLTKNPVILDLARVLPATIELAGLSILIGAGLGIPLGIVAATQKGKWIDQVARVVGLVGYSTPIFWLGTLVLLLFYAQLGWIPGSGRIDIYNEGLVEGPTRSLLLDPILAGEWEVFWSALHHLITPALILGYASMAYISRMSRSFMLEQLGQEYVLTARAKGLPRRSVVWGHAFRNIRVQLLTIVTLAFCGLLEGTVLIETVFAWPGIGRLMLEALLQRDYPVLLGVFLVTASMAVVFNLLTDWIYTIADPRIQLT